MRTTYAAMFASARALQQRLTTDQKIIAEFETVADMRCSADELIFHYAIEKVCFYLCMAIELIWIHVLK